MRIAQIRWQPYRMPFRRPIVTAHGAQGAREGAIVTVTAADGLVGHGEFVALPEFNHWSLAELLADLAARAAALRGAEVEAAHIQIFRAVIEGAIPPQVGFALDTALFDLLAQATGVSYAQFVTPNPLAAIPVNAVIGDPAVAGACDQAIQAVARGFGCVKLKVGMLADAAAEIARIIAVRVALEPTVQLRLDANEAWTLDQALAVVRGCTGYAIEYIEQPLRRADLAGMCALRVRSLIPIAADEAITDQASIARVIAAQAADVLILKPQMIGGHVAVQRAISQAQSALVKTVITSSLDCGIGVAAASHIAASTAQQIMGLACGLATLDLLEDDVIIEGLPITNGMLAVPQGPGLGVTLDAAALARYAL